MQYAFLLHMTLTLGRLDCVTSKRNVCVWGKELGLLFYASPLSVYLGFTFLKLFLHTWSIVRVLYSVRIACFIPSVQSVVRSPCLTPTVVDNSLPTGTSKPGSPQVALPYLQEATDLFSHLLVRKTRLVNGGI